jgi:hypothetical protein
MQILDASIEWQSRKVLEKKKPICPFSIYSRQFSIVVTKYLKPSNF